MKLIINILILIISHNAFSQDIVMFKPNSECGKDAIMTNSPTWNNGTSPNAIPNPSSPFLRIEAWTANANGSPEHDWRSLIEFEQLRNIQSAEVNSATLVLYSYPDFPYSNGGQSEINTSEVYRVIESWEEDQVTWLSQPNVDLNGIVEIAQNNNYDLIEVDVTDMVQTMIDSPDDSFGFLIRQKDESPYGSMNFASSDYPVFSKVPELILIGENIQYSPNSEICMDCNGITNGTFIIDDCGFCLEPNDPNFNQACLDCNGIINGTSIIDDCGVCLEPNDPNFNQACLDCNGIINGTSIIDDCGVCLEPNDPNFNQVCLDCNGIINGTSIIDDCGVCLEPNDPNFNQVCLRSLIFIPNAFSPNFDGINDIFQIFKHPELVAQIKNISVFDRWGSSVYQNKNLEFNSISGWWEGSFCGKVVASGVYVYYIEIEFPYGVSTIYRGDISIFR